MDSLFGRIIEFLSKVFHEAILFIGISFFATIIASFIASEKFRRTFSGYFARGSRGDIYVKQLGDALEVLKSSWLFHHIDGQPRRLRWYSNFLALAFAYPVFWAFVAWAFNANLTVGDQPLFPMHFSDLERLILFFALLTCAILLVPLTLNAEAVDTALRYIIRAGKQKDYDKKLSLATGVVVWISISWIVLQRGFSPPMREISYLIAALLGFCAYYSVLTSGGDGSSSIGGISQPIGHTAVNFVFGSAACIALAGNIPVHMAMPIAAAIAALNGIRLQVVFGIFVIPFAALGLLWLQVRGYLVDSAIGWPVDMIARGFKQEPSDFVFAVTIAFLTSLPVWIAVSQRRKKLGWLIGAITVLPVAIPLLLRNLELNPAGAKVMIVYWFLFPVIAALFDLISWRIAFTWAEKLVNEFRDDMEEFENADSAHGAFVQVARKIYVIGSKTVVPTAAGVVIALLFSFAIGFFVSIAEGLAGRAQLGALSDLNKVARTATENYQSMEAIWLTAMLLTPLIPVLVHFGLIVFLFLLVPFSFPSVRKRLAVFANANATVDASKQKEALFEFFWAFIGVVLLQMLILEGVRRLGVALFEGRGAYLQWLFQSVTYGLDFGSRLFR